VSCQPVDQFPFTPHCELIARFEPIPGFVPPAEEDVVYGRSKPDSRARKADAESALGGEAPDPGAPE